METIGREPDWRPSTSFSPDGTMIALGGKNEVLVFEIETGTQIATLGHSRVRSAPGINAPFDSTGNKIACWSSSYVRAWNTGTWKSAKAKVMELDMEIIHVTWTESMCNRSL
jgi:WD40 repeat protein